MSLRRAINDHCRSCIYDKAAPGTWRQQVASCAVTACALYPHRPKPKDSIKAPNRHQKTAQTTKTDAATEPTAEAATA